MTIEEALKQAENYAAMLAYLTDVRCEPYAAPSEAALTGLVDACRQIERHTRDVRRALPPRTLKVRMAEAPRP